MFGARRQGTDRRDRRPPATTGPDGEPVKRKPRQPAKNYGAWLLGRREWSEKELRARFALKGYEEPEIGQAIKFLKEHGFQSDERFAGSKVRMNSTRAGNAKLQQKLKQAGVSEEIAEQALENALPELERATVLMARKFGGRPADVETKTKAWRFLMSRGFSSGTVEKAWRDFKEKAQTRVDDDEDLGPFEE